ncbi:hypothetical protein [Paracoccus sp. ME4]|uniref:hypothetical protein n=1 Tax=Paracoccus sp. ME4 TaxID=3138066 RepID=UPI00398B18AF
MRRACALIAVMLASGCLANEPQSYGLSFGSDAASPVVVTSVAVNGEPVGMMPQLIDALSDQVMPRANSGSMIMPYPPGDGRTLGLDVQWVELLTRRAYRASASVPVAALESDGAGSVDIAPVFGTGGLMRVTSDPVPGPDGAQPIRDLLLVCGTREPTLDADFAADPGALPGLDIVLAAGRPAPGPSACPAAGG